MVLIVLSQSLHHLKKGKLPIEGEAVSLSNVFMFVVNKTSNDVIGYTATTPQGTENTDSLVQPLWSVHIPEEQEIIEVQSHRQSGMNYFLQQ